MTEQVEVGVDRRAIPYAVLVGLFTGSLVASNYLASKIFQADILGYKIFAPAAVLAYAATFLFTDIISEVYGKEASGKAVLIGFFTEIIVLFYNWFALKLPYAPFSPANPETYRVVVGSSGTVIAASLTAYIISQTHDVYAFHFWKKVTRGKWLWFRNNASTMVSQFIDTVIFISLAFNIYPALVGGKVLPWNVIGNIIIGQYIVKWLIALGDTPFVYLGTYLVRHYLGLQPAYIIGTLAKQPSRTGEARSGALR